MLSWHPFLDAETHSETEWRQDGGAANRIMATVIEDSPAWCDYWRVVDRPCYSGQGLGCIIWLTHDHDPPRKRTLSVCPLLLSETLAKSGDSSTATRARKVSMPSLRLAWTWTTLCSLVCPVIRWPIFKSARTSRHVWSPVHASGIISNLSWWNSTGCQLSRGTGYNASCSSRCTRH